MKYCSKCHKLLQDNTVCSNCQEPLTEPKSEDLVLLIAAMYEESDEIINAFAAKGIYLNRQPAIEKGVFELFVRYDDWEQAKEILKIILKDIEKHRPSEYANMELSLKEQKLGLSNKKKWLLRIAAALMFGLLIWGVITLTDFGINFIKGLFS